MFEHDKSCNSREIKVKGKNYNRVGYYPYEFRPNLIVAVIENQFSTPDKFKKYLEEISDTYKEIYKKIKNKYPKNYIVKLETEYSRVLMRQEIIVSVYKPID